MLDRASKASCNLPPLNTTLQNRHRLQSQLQVAELICRLTATQGTSFLGKLRGRWVFVCYSAAEVGCSLNRHLLMCHAARYPLHTLHRLCLVLEQAACSLNTE